MHALWALGSYPTIEDVEEVGVWQRIDALGLSQQLPVLREVLRNRRSLAEAFAMENSIQTSMMGDVVCGFGMPVAC
jgi:hypothetical protein